jgi:hypothetical protein
MENFKDGPVPANSRYYVNNRRRIGDVILGFLASGAVGYAIYMESLSLDKIFPEANPSYGHGVAHDFLIVVLPLAIFYLAFRIPLAVKRYFFILGFLLPYAIFFCIWLFLLVYLFFNPITFG